MNIQNLIKSFSPEKRQEIQKYVLDNMSTEIREATLHGAVTPEMQNELEKIIIQFLEIHYPDDIRHTISVSKNEVEEKISNLVDKQLDFMANQPIEENPQVDIAGNNSKPSQEQLTASETTNTQVLFNMGHKPRQLAQVIPPQQHNQPQHQNEVAQVPVKSIPSQAIVPASGPVSDQVEDYGGENLLGENTGYDQSHDHENRIFGFQRRIYKLLAITTDDETSESYFRIVMVIGGIMVFLGAWNLFNDMTTISSMKDYFQVKTPMYMRQLAEFCQTSMSNIKQFQVCIADRQADLILSRRIDAVKDFFVIACGAVVLFISYFLKLNYRGRDAYLDQQDV